MSNDKIDSFAPGLVDVILEAHKRGFTVQCDFARSRADFVAMAASLGLITTRVFRNVFSREWRPTVKGLAYLNEKGLEADDE